MLLQSMGAGSPCEKLRAHGTLLQGGDSWARVFR